MTTTIEQPTKTAEAPKPTLLWHRITAIEPGTESPGMASENVEVDPAFHVVNEQCANWVIRHVVQAREQASKAKAWAERECDQAERTEAFFMNRFGDELRAWLKTDLADSDRKSVDLPAGRVGTKKAPAKLVWLDDAKLLAWARKNLPAAVVVVPATEHVSKSELIIKWKANGEIPDGADVQPSKDELYVK